MDTSGPTPACCAPRREGVHADQVSAVLLTMRSAPTAAREARHRVEQMSVPAQRFLMGDAQGVGRLADGELPGAGAGLDAVDSFAGLRSVAIAGKAVRINGDVVFQRLVLDQGWYPAGLMTAPTDADLVW